MNALTHVVRSKLPSLYPVTPGFKHLDLLPTRCHIVSAQVISPESGNKPPSIVQAIVPPPRQIYPLAPTFDIRIILDTSAIRKPKKPNIHKILRTAKNYEEAYVRAFNAITKRGMDINQLRKGKTAVQKACDNKDIRAITLLLYALGAKRPDTTITPEITPDGCLKVHRGLNTFVHRHTIKATA